MNLTTTPEQDAVFASEAAIRNKSLAADSALWTAQSVADDLLEKSAAGYAQTHAANYARGLYDRIQAASPAKQQAIFQAAEQALSTP